MPEQQNIEYKQSWRDEYLKWICGFANAQGGKIYIGIDDNGAITGIDDYKKLMDDIPNKAVNHHRQRHQLCLSKEKCIGAILGS